MINISQITKSYNGKYKAVDNLNLDILDLKKVLGKIEA